MYCSITPSENWSAALGFAAGSSSSSLPPLPGSSPDGTWEGMLYPDFHRHYRVVAGRAIPLSNQRAPYRQFWRCSDRGEGGHGAVQPRRLTMA